MHSKYNGVAGTFWGRSKFFHALNRIVHTSNEVCLTLVSKHVYRPQTKFAKVMFLHVSVFLSTGEGAIPACIAGGIPACLAAGLQGGSPGPQPRGKLRGIWPGGAYSRGVPALGVVVWRPPTMTATAAGGTHPTGIHSCITCLPSEYLDLFTVD